MQGILQEPVFPPLLPRGARGRPAPFAPEGAAAAAGGPHALYAALLARQQRPLTAAELFAKKQAKPPTPKEQWLAQWRVPGLDELVRPLPKAVVTATEARRRFKAVTADPFVDEYA